MSEINGLSQEERNFAMFCHFAAFAGFIFPVLGSILAPLILWQMKKEESGFIDHHGKEAVNFQITMLIAFSIAIFLSFLLIGIPMLFGLAIFEIIAIILAGIKANEGEYYRYPLSIRFIN
ncbi:DUF4870 domain-containing protein [Aliikangiella sp. G2MR2-5]|uniref:DUF4870 domain-containing protein n=1 Tax=Aliikangiella sp. G2MR2-5 TaxID=2788943 RepID=UPI001AEE548E|nr:DUF4870 domain-containing protein [Aliikangiella sp. G2MR2-5]